MRPLLTLLLLVLVAHAPLLAQHQGDNALYSPAALSREGTQRTTVLTASPLAKQSSFAEGKAVLTHRIWQLPGSPEINGKSNTTPAMAPLSPMAPTTPSISVSPGILSHVFTTCNDSVLLPITVFNTGSSDLILDTLIGGTLGDSLYSFQNFTFAGAATTHNFTGLPTNLDSLKVTVNMDGDFNSSGEFAELLIDNVNLGVIPDFGQYVVSYTTFITGPQLSSFLADGNLSVVIDNSIQVDIFTSQLNFHEVILEYGNGNTWIQSNGVVNDTIPAGDSATVLVKVNAAGLNAGTYQDSVAIFSNDPAVNPIYLPITLFNNGPAELDVSSSCLTFDTLQQFTADSLPLAVTNNGCDTLVISGINTSTGVYNASPTSLSILPGNTDSIWVQFSPTGIGLLTDTLQLITNANDTNVCLSGFALAAPSIAVNPDTVQVTLSSCNDSTNVPLAIINNGLGPLTFNVNQSGSGSGPLNVLAWTVGADLSREYPNTISGINSFFTSYSLSTSTTLLPSVLQSQLSGVDVLLLPEMETTAIGTITTLASTIQNFVNNGGWVVLCGNSVARVNALGLFNISTGSTSSSGAQIVVDPSSPLLTGVTGSIFNASATFHQTVTNTDFQTVTSYVGQSVVGHRDIGFGKVVYVGFDFFNSNANLDRILANAFVWAQNQSPNWVSVTPTSGTVAALDSQLLNVGVNGSGLVSGTYTGSIGISSNDPATPILNVPLVLNINGSPEITFSDSCVHFDTLMQFTDDTLGLWVYNPGCDTLLISNITSGNGDVGTVPGALTIPPYDSALVNVFFSPDTMQTYTGMLTFFSNAGDSTVCYSGVATGAPVISVNPDSIQLTINCGDSASVPLTVFNTGQGPLNFNFSSASGGSSGATPNVVVWAYAADNSLGGEVANTLNGINNYFTNYTSVTSLTTVPAVLQGLLSTADVLLIPEQENSVGFVNQNMAPVINNFLVSGGWVVVCGTQAAKINDLGFFNISASPNSSTGIQTIVDPSSPLLNNTTLPISNANATFYSTFTDPGFQTVTSYLSGTVTGWENVGAGRAIYIGYDYFSSNPNADRIVANAIAWSAQNTSNWISANPDSGTVAIGDSSLITVTANGTGLAAGTYNGNLQVNSNDPLNPSLSIPVILTVVGTPEIDLSDSCITFDTTLQFTTDTSGIWVFNPGCDSLQISNITASNGDVSFDTTALVIPPFDSAWVTAIFAPDTAQNYTGTITIFNNAGDTTICFNGPVIGAPVISVQPDSLLLTVNCDDSAAAPITVFNTGQGPLNFNFSSGSGGSSGATPNVVVWAYAADNSFGGEVANTLNGINNYFTNYTSVTSLTTVPAVLQGLLATADVLLIPEQENNVGFVNQNMAPVINNFLVNGGWVVICGTQAAKINDLGFFTISASPNSSAGIQTIVDPSSPLINNTVPPIANANATFYSTFTDPGFQTVTSYLGGTVSGWEDIGAGKAIYIGYDYFNTTPNSERMVANAIAWAANNTSNWITVSPDSGTVAAGDSTTVTVTANGAGLIAGVYPGNISVSSNDPVNPGLNIPVILTVVGTPEIDLSDSCITFDTTQQFTTDTSGIWVYNTGCDSLQISNITASNGDVSFDTTALVIPPYDSAWVIAIFAPDTAQNYSGSITIFNNAGDTTICFTGPVVGAPAIAVQPDSILLTVNCDDSVSVPLTVYNTGTGPLNFNFSSSNGGTSGASPNVVVWAYAADNSFGGEVANTLNGINNYFTNYTSVTSLTTVPSVLQGLLATADVLLIPEQENSVGLVNQNMASVINNFLVNGGWVVICGTQAAKINDLGFFNISSSPNSSTGIQTIVDPSSPLLNNTVPPIANANATFYSTFTDPGFQTVTSYLGGTVSGWEDIGAGKAIYIGYDYFNTTPNSERMVANAIAWAANNTSNWITVSPDSGTVAAGDSTTVTVTANGAGLIAGVYPGNISVSSNDPVNPGLNIPVILTVVGTPEIDLSDSCITFDTTQQFTTDTSGIWVYNTGCDSLQISNITASNGDVSFDTTALVIPPYDSAWVIAIFAPDTAQNYSGSITIFNNAGDTTICFTGPVVGAPAIAVQPDSILLTVNCDDSVSVPLTVYNTGTGPLNFNFSSSNGGTSGASPNVVVWAYAADNSFGGEVANTLNGINNYFTNYTSVTSLTTVPSVLQGLLATADVLLIPEQENSVGLVNQNMASVINNFLVNGGWVVICGTQAAKINDLGFFNISSSPNSSTGIQTIVDPSSPLLNNTVPPIANANATFYSTFTDPGFQTVTSYLSGTVSGWEDIGAGKAIYIGYDYFNTTPNSERMVANAIAWAANNTSNWITVNPDSGSVAAGDSTTVTVTASGNGLSAGVYPGNISVSSNDPVNPALNIPVILTVLGTPEIDLSDSCITFDTTLQFTNDTSGIWVYNTGCDSLQVTNIVSSNGDVTLGASSLTVAPYDSVWLPAYFSPDTVQNYTGSITLFNNAGDTTICFTGSVIGAPQISLVPDSIGVTLGCFDSVMVPVTIYNTGNGPLNVNISGGSSGTGTSTNIDVLAWTYGADLSFNGEYNNTINAINNYFTNYNLTATGTTTPSALQSALVGKEVLLIPEQEITNPNPINVLMAPIIQNFLAAGGWVVHCGAQGPKVSSVGVINISGGFSSSGTQTIVDPSSPLLINVTGSIFNTSATFYGNVTTPGFQTVTSYLSQTVSGHIDVGAGKYIYIGFDYFNSNINTERMIANAINWAATSAVPWTTITPDTASLAAGASSVVVVKIVSDSLATGAYQASYTVASTDPANPFVSLPVHLTVVSTPVLAVTDSCINLGNIPQSQTVTDSMLFSNVGCSPLQVTGTSTSTSALGLSLSSLVVPAGGTDTAFVSYASPVVGPFTETFTLTTNGNDTTICVTGNIVGTSAIAINSPSIGPSIRVCDSISVQTIYVKNNGSQVLSWTYTPTGANPPVLTPATGVVQPSDSIAVIVVVPNAGVVGIQNVQLNFTTNAPSAPTASHTINYQMTNEPCAAYGINVVSTCDGVVQFNDQSVGGVLSYNWNFGDGNSANSANPQHTYAASGVYTVTQVVCGVASCDTLTQTGNVSAGSSVTAATCYPVATAPTASTGITSVQLNTLNNASGNSLEGYQDFSCTIGTQLVVTNSYTLTVTTGGVSQNVKAWIDYNNDGLFAGSELVLQSTGSTHTATVTPATGTVLNVPLRMRVRTGVQVPSSGPCDAPVDGQIEDYFVEVLSNNQVPVAQFNADVAVNCSGVVTFTDQSQNSPSSWSWDFGDGNSSNQQNPVHQYNASGTYIVKLVAANSTGADSITQTIDVDLFDLSFIVSGQLNAQSVLTFVPTGSPTVSNWSWVLGDGNSSSLQQPTHTYAAAGTYVVVLNASNPAGCTAIAVDTLTIDFPVGIEVNGQAVGMQVFPNPNKGGDFTFRYEGDEKQLQLQLLDYQGQLLLQTQQRVETGFLETNFAALQLASGVYFLRVNGEQRSEVLRVVVQ